MPNASKAPTDERRCVGKVLYIGLSDAGKTLLAHREMCREGLHKAIVLGGKAVHEWQGILPAENIFDCVGSRLIQKLAEADMLIVDDWESLRNAGIASFADLMPIIKGFKGNSLVVIGQEGYAERKVLKFNEIRVCMPRHQSS